MRGVFAAACERCMRRTIGAIDRDEHHLHLDCVQDPHPKRQVMSCHDKEAWKDSSEADRLNWEVSSEVELET